MIYHVVYRDSWLEAVAKGVYIAVSFTTEGFIHSSKAEQVSGVLERYYREDIGQNCLLLLHIDETKLSADLRYEMAPSVGELFPHIYGPLNLDAVVKIEEI